MPAFQLLQLQEHIDEFAWQFNHPVEFCRSLRNLFERYANRSYQPGQKVIGAGIHPAYHIPPMILSKLEQTIRNLCLENPSASLALADSLWFDEFLEPRLIAALLLGQAPMDPPTAVVERMRNWARPEEPAVVLDALFNNGSFRLRREQPRIWLKLFEEWLSDLNIAVRAMGLRALPPTIKDQKFDNLPPIFNLVGGLTDEAPEALYAGLLDALEALSFRTPVETTYFLRQLLASSAPGSIRLMLIRRIFPYLEPSVHENLRSSFRRNTE